MVKFGSIALLKGQIFMSDITNDLLLVVERLQNNAIAAIPTETVYGLAANAFSEVAIKKVFEVKNRPLNHPLIMHVAPEWDLTTWVAHLSDETQALIKAFWPGPLTIVFPVKPKAIHPLVTGGQNTVAIRAPRHPLVQALLLELGQPLVAPSANPYGKISPTTAQHVQQSFPVDDFIILDGGRCAIGLESTIVNEVAPGQYQILRQGMIDEHDIAAISAEPLIQGRSDTRAPGGLLTHYQPEKRLYYTDDIRGALSILEQQYQSPFVLTFSKSSCESGVWSYTFPLTSDRAAYELYYQLRVADLSLADCILIELPPNIGNWRALREKITKAGELILPHINETNYLELEA